MPLIKNNHPGINTSEHCTNEEIKQYQSMIGQLLWLFSVDRFNTFISVMSLFQFRTAPRKEHFMKAHRSMDTS